jgi:hypothetical protein
MYDDLPTGPSYACIPPFRAMIRNSGGRPQPPPSHRSSLHSNPSVCYDSSISCLRFATAELMKRLKSSVPGGYPPFTPPPGHPSSLRKNRTKKKGGPSEASAGIWGISPGKHAHRREYRLYLYVERALLLI